MDSITSDTGQAGLVTVVVVDQRTKGLRRSDQPHPRNRYPLAICFSWSSGPSLSAIAAG